MLDVGEHDGPPPLRRASTTDTGDSRYSPSPSPPHYQRSRLTRRASLDDLENESCQLTPRLEGRIVLLNEERRRELLLERQRLEEDSVIPEVEDECSPQGSIDQS